MLTPAPSEGIATKAFYRGLRGWRGWSEILLPLSALSAQSAVKDFRGLKIVENRNRPDQCEPIEARITRTKNRSARTYAKTDGLWGLLLADRKVRDGRTPKTCREGDEPKLVWKISSIDEIRLAVTPPGSSLEVPRRVTRNANRVFTARTGAASHLGLDPRVHDRASGGRPRPIQRKPGFGFEKFQRAGHRHIIIQS